VILSAIGGIVLLNTISRTNFQQALELRNKRWRSRGAVLLFSVAWVVGNTDVVGAQ